MTSKYPEFPSPLHTEYARVLEQLDDVRDALTDVERRKAELESQIYDGRVPEAVALKWPTDPPADTWKVAPARFDLRIADLVLPTPCVVLRYEDGDGWWVALTSEQTQVMSNALFDAVGHDALHHLPHETSALTLEECIRQGEHCGSIEPDGTCTHCDLLSRPPSQ